MIRALWWLALLTLLAAACSEGSVTTVEDGGTESASEVTVTSAASSDVEATAAPSALELTSTHEITGFGFTIDIPSGWFVESRNTVTGIAALEDDLEQALIADGPRSYAGVTILLDHRSLSFMEGLGLPSESPTADDLLDLNIGFFGWTDLVDRPQVSLFGAPARAVLGKTRSGQPVLAVQAVRLDEGDIFVLSMQAPSEVALEDVLPTWEAMVASVRMATETPLAAGPTGTFNVGSHDLFITCAGEGSPTVVLEAPLGSDSGIWGGVLPAVAGFTRVCAYDRAGTGASDSAPEQSTRTGSQIVEELRALLVEAGVDGPYTVVGHSFGGLLVRLFAQGNPDVAGVVLVESSHPDQIDRFAEVLGLPGSNEPDDFNPEEVDVAAVSGEASTVSSFGSIPLVVLTRGQPQPLGPGVPAEVATRAEELWQELQIDLLGLSTNAVQLIAEDSGHNVPVEQPERVVDAIELLIEQVRSAFTS